MAGPAIPPLPPTSVVGQKVTLVYTGVADNGWDGGAWVPFPVCDSAGPSAATLNDTLIAAIRSGMKPNDVRALATILTAAK